MDDCPAGASLAGGWVPVWFSTEPASRGAVGLFDYGKGAMVGLEQPRCLVPAGTIAHELGHALGLRDRNGRIQALMERPPDYCSIIPSEREAAVARHLVFGVAEIADRIRPRAELIRDALGEASGPGFYPRLEDGKADQLVYWRPCYPASGEPPCTAEVVADALDATSCRRITKWLTMESTVAGDHWLWPFYDALAARTFGEWPTYTASVWHGWYDSTGEIAGGKVVVEWVDYWRDPHMYRVTCA